MTIGDTLIPFKVILYLGDELIQKFEINVYIKSGKYYADNVSPYSYYGKQTDSVWTVELDQFQISECDRFLNKAKSLPKECPQTSSSVTDYTITFANKTIKIKGDCEWGKLDFFSLRQLIFKDKFDKVEVQRTDLIKDINKKLLGTWYFKPPLSEPKRGDYLSLTKANDLNSECSWSFGHENAFKCSCQKIYSFNYSDKYELEVDGDIHFIIKSGVFIDKNGDRALGSSGTFTIESLTDNELKLKFLWR